MEQNFDLQRAILMNQPEPRPLDVQGYIPLGQAIEQNRLHPEQHILIATVGQSVVALPLLDMVYHHVAQGQLDGIQWIAAYCCLCNGGSIFDATHDGHCYTFGVQGYYDMMIVIADQQTQSYWNHLTGECLHGALSGATLNRLGVLRQMLASEALTTYPTAQVAQPADSAVMTVDELATAQRWDTTYRVAAEPNFGEDLTNTGGKPDTRLPRYEMGLGLWTAQTSRFYPIIRLYEQDNVIVDQVDGRNVIIVLNETVGLPFAFYWDRPADNIHWRGDRLILDTDSYYQHHALYTNGQRITPETPVHVVIRWYGFSSVFPGCDIYQKPD